MIIPLTGQLVEYYTSFQVHISYSCNAHKLSRIVSVRFNRVTANQISSFISLHNSIFTHEQRLILLCLITTYFAEVLHRNSL
ncbi:hypothetical protein D3C73_1600510 [compost metagenome]